MRSLRVVAVVFATALMLTACSSADSGTDGGSQSSSDTGTSTVPGESTVVIQGKEYTCEEITASLPQQCGEYTQQAFDAYKENIDAYVNSGKLGPLNNGGGFTYEDAAFAGLVACAYVLAGEGQETYVEFMLATPPFDEKLKDVGGVGVLPAWFEAQKSLCPAGYQSTDLEAP